jgi:hypothetical protein
MAFKPVFQWPWHGHLLASAYTSVIVVNLEVESVED